MTVIKFVLYGLPCAGKTTLLNSLDITVINGSVELNKLSSGKFSELDEDEKNRIRVQYAERLAETLGTLISDGHYAMYFCIFIALRKLSANGFAIRKRTQIFPEFRRKISENGSALRLKNYGASATSGIRIFM